MLRSNIDIFYSQRHPYTIYLEKNLKLKNDKVHCGEAIISSTKLPILSSLIHI